MSQENPPQSSSENGEARKKPVAVAFADEETNPPLVRIPKWLRYPMMFIPAGIIAGIVIIIDRTVGFPETIFPAAIIALIGLATFFLVVIGDMLYRNIFVYRMLRQENKRARVYKEIIREREATRRAQAKYELEDEEPEDEYEYDEDEEEFEEEEEEEQAELEDEYSYEELEDEQTSYRLKSFILRGGLVSILIVNSLVLLILAAILQKALYGGFSVPTNSTTTIFPLF
ncbi:MAG: hypothetical protein K9W42_00275 [Candidatus Heimdallarchaeota archaeon]|nr:hypothetical protein [Candidatus Heimdallarchaeota archaeon]